MNSIIDYLEQWAAVQPNKCVWSFLDVRGKERASYTYLDFSNRTRTLAEYLSQQVGLKYGDRVLLVYPPGLDVIVAFYACVRVGVIPVPVPAPAIVNFDLGLAKLGFVAEDCQARTILTTQEYYRSYRLRLARCQSSRFPKIAALPDLEWVATDDVSVRGADSFHNRPNDILFLQYTSGSTSDPKGVMVSHQNVIHNALGTVDHVPIGVSWLPQYHDMGLIGFYLFPLIFGGTTYGFSPMDFLKQPILWLQTMSRVRATCASSPNFGFEYCLREDKVPSTELDGTDLSSLRVLMNAAEPVRAGTYFSFLERFRRYGLQPESHVVGYGLAENTLAVTRGGRRIITVDRQLLLQGCLRIDNVHRASNNQLRLVSCGTAVDGVHLRIVKSGSCTPVGERQIGEIWLGGKSVCRGYWRRPALTREVFRNGVSNDPEDNNFYLRTGDLGFLAEGELFVCGRVKDLIIINGANYYPQDIETIVESAFSNIRPGGVVAFNGAEDEGTLVLAVEVKNRNNLPDADEIARVIRTQCYVAPHTILLVPPRTILKTTSGKVARSLTRQLFLCGRLSSIATYCYPNKQEQASMCGGLRKRFQYLLKQYNLTGREEFTFPEVGMDSLSLVEFLLDVNHLLQDRGASDLVDAVDIQFLQGLTVGEFFSLLDEFDMGSEQAIATWGQCLKRAQREYETRVRNCMRADAFLELSGPIAAAAPHQPAEKVLLTGATGFFGPFLLHSLLRRTPCTYYILTRAVNQTHGLERIRNSLRRSLLWTPSIAEEVEKRVHVVCGDLARHNLGLGSEEWESLSTRIDAVCHNAALVNYVLNYQALKSHNVDGTRELLRFSFTGRQKEFHHISSTFVFGWTVKGTLMESDNNDEMTNLDFGYSQSKWVAEQLVFAAAKHGLRVRVYRPSLITASTRGSWDQNDVALRLLAFMINHGIAVYSENQLSFLPADVVSDNIASMFTRPEITARTFHITADDYYNMTDVSRLISVEYGYSFEYYDIPRFIAEMNQRCASSEPLYPLLDFFNQSYGKIAAMQLKRYNNEQYRKARQQSGGRCDPLLKDTIGYLMAYMLRAGVITDCR